MKWTKLVLTVMLAFTFILAVPAYKVLAEDAVLNTLVVLPTGDYNTQEAKEMIGRLEKIPAPILKALADKGVKIKLTNDIITNEPEFKKLKGITPRGWEKTGLTWDDVPGISEQIVAVRIGYSKQGKGHTCYNLELHETMHAVDRFVFNEASGTEEFKKIFDAEANVNYKKDGYISVYPTEYFAETASLYLYSDTTREELKKSTPLTYDYMDKLFNR